MNYLLDTHILIWAATNSPKLPKAAFEIISDPNNSLWVSVASLWEVAIKRSKLRAEFPYDVGSLRAGLLSNAYEELPIDASHVLLVQDLPPHHTDPFDRLLVAQSISEGFVLLTANQALQTYGASVRVV